MLLWRSCYQQSIGVRVGNQRGGIAKDRYIGNGLAGKIPALSEGITDTRKVESV
jgi:hypothetical protein